MILARFTGRLTYYCIFSLAFKSFYYYVLHSCPLATYEYTAGTRGTNARSCVLPLQLATPRDFKPSYNRYIIQKGNLVYSDIFSLVVIMPIGFLGCVDSTYETAGDPFVFFSRTQRHRVLPRVTTRPKCLRKGNLLTVFNTIHVRLRATPAFHKKQQQAFFFFLWRRFSPP